MSLTRHRYKLLTVVGALLALLVLGLCAPTAVLAQAGDDMDFGQDDFGGMNQQEAEGALAWIAAIGTTGMILIVVIELAILVAIILAISSCFKRIPPQHRKMEPGMVWLMIVPCLNIVWNFIVVIRLADSYKSYFDAAGRTDVGDCGKGIGIGYAVAILICGPVGLILLIVWLIKVLGLKKLIPEGGAAAA